MKTIKDYVVEYQNGNAKVLNKLIGFRKVRERNNNGDIDLIDRLRFNDKALDYVYQNICKTFSNYDYKDIDPIILESLFGEKSIFDNIDISKSEKEILVFVSKRLTGYVQDKIKKENLHYYGNTIPESSGNETVDDDGDKNTSLYDNAAFSQYQQISNKYSLFETFKNECCNGDVKNLLKSDDQKRLYDLLQDTTLTQEKIAKEYGSSQANVSQLKSKIEKKLNEEFLYWKALKSLDSETKPYTVINEFLKNLSKIQTYDVTDSFDYFGYIIQFLKENYNSDEEKIEFDATDLNGMDKISKHQLHISVIDTVTDNIGANTYEVLSEVVFKNNKHLELITSRKKAFVKDVIEALHKYIDESKVGIKKVTNKIVSGELDQKTFHKNSI